MLVTVHRARALTVLLMVDAMFVALHLFTRVATWDGEPIVKRHEFLDRYWLGLAGIFLYLSADEGSQLHEGFIAPMQELFDISGGFLHFAWVIPGSAALLVFLAIYVRFWWRLPAAPRMWMALGGLSFVAGAIGGEMVTGAYKEERGVDRGFAALNAVEEGLEVLGASLFIFSLLCLLQRWQGAGATIRVDDRPVTRDFVTNE